MTIFRSRQTIEAVQYTGTPIADITCEPRADDKEEAERRKNCHSVTSAPHVHAAVPGGLAALKEGDWITPVPGGPFAVITDAQFRANWEVQESAPAEHKLKRPPLPETADDQPEVATSARSTPTTKSEKVRRAGGG